MNEEDLIKLVEKHPDLLMSTLEEALAEESLLEYVKVFWPTLEGERPLKIGWALEAMAEHLEAVERGEIKRLLMNVPPGLMKSLITCVFFPSWLWGPKRRTSTSFFAASYALELAYRDNERMSKLLNSELHQQLYPHIDLRKDSTKVIENTANGFKTTGSTTGGATGKRADIGIIDDPLSVSQAESELERAIVRRWFSNTWPTRINDPENSAQILIMQRLHTEDISGIILEAENNLGYETLILPMEFEPDRKCYTRIGWEDPRTKKGELLFPERFSKHHLENELKPQLRLDGGEYAIAGQLQQRPAPRGGGLIKVNEIGKVDKPPENVVARVRAWDLAGTRSQRSAYTVGVLMSYTTDKSIVIEDVIRGRWTSNQVANKIEFCCANDLPNTIASVPKDPGQAGEAQADYYRNLLSDKGYIFRITSESGDKVLRALPLSTQVEAGNVYIVKAEWNDEFLSELGNFPTGKWKDQVDACSRGYAELLKLIRQANNNAPPIIVTRNDMYRK